MKILLVFVFFLASYPLFSQQNVLSVEQAIDQALKNNITITNSQLELESQRQLKGTSFNLPKTDVMLLYGQYNSYIKNDNNITVSQSIPFSAFGSQGSANRASVQLSELKKAVSENDVIYQVKRVFYQLAFTHSRYELLQQQDSIYEGFLKAASLRYQTGETNLLEETTAEAQRNESRNQLRQIGAEIAGLRTQLRLLLNTDALPETQGELSAIPFENAFDTTDYKTNPSLTHMRQQVEVAVKEKKLEAARSAPDLLVGFFSQTLAGGPLDESGTVATTTDRFTGFQIGVSLPLWYRPHRARVRAADLDTKVAENNFRYHEQSLKAQIVQAAEQVNIHNKSLEYYRTSGLLNADRILKQSQLAFREGEIDYAEYLLGIRNAISIREGYLKTLHDYNQAVIYIKYLTGNQE
jgi:cobalt-zinc-cadmium resistance protein CzcA